MGGRAGGGGSQSHQCCPLLPGKLLQRESKAEWGPEAPDLGSSPDDPFCMGNGGEVAAVTLQTASEVWSLPL